MNLENIHRLFNGEITIEGMNLYDPKTIINLLTLTDPSLNHKKVLVLQLWKRSQKKKYYKTITNKCMYHSSEKGNRSHFCLLFVAEQFCLLPQVQHTYVKVNSFQELYHFFYSFLLAVNWGCCC